MYYDVYIDIVFLTNLFMDYILLRIVGKLFLRKKKPQKDLAGGSRRRPFFLPHSLCTIGWAVSGKGASSWRLCLDHAGSGTGA